MNGQDEGASNVSGQSRARARQGLTIVDADRDELRAIDWAGLEPGEVRLVNKAQHDGRAVSVHLSPEQVLQLGTWLLNYEAPTATAREWLDSYTGRMDPGRMRFSADEMLLAFRSGRMAAGEASPDPVGQHARCSSCSWWDGGLIGGKGQCRVNPPLTGVQAYGLLPGQRDEIPQALGAAWPITSEVDWCAQHSELQVTIVGEEMTVDGLARTMGEQPDDRPPLICDHPTAALQTREGGTVECGACGAVL